MVCRFTRRRNSESKGARYYKSSNGDFGAVGVIGAVGAGVAGGAGVGATGVKTAAGGCATTVFAGSISVDAIGRRTMLLLKFTRTFCPSIAINRTFVPELIVTLPNCS